ncbi:MAG: hypothetical protein JAY74_25395 [Candidatus Thiodiazotropha taylori]|nr:hypothetical protein [Candidatus Thiodiazotropha taylori]
MDQVSTRIVFGTILHTQLKDLDENALRLVYENFIDPIRRGYTIEELPGKYKPSWLLKDHVFNNQMKKAIADFAKKNDLHHYHYGYPFYVTGRDPDFFGHESDGILHTVNRVADDFYEHVIFRVDECHPTPFSVPFDLSINSSVFL